MKKLLSFLILLSITFNSIAQQVDSCGTPDADSAIITNFPWFGNNVFLTNLVDSIKNANTCNNCRYGYEGGVGSYVYQIPVRVILYYDNTHNALTDPEVQWYINRVNEIYKDNGFKVQLYLDKCGPFRKYSTLYAYAGNWGQMNATAMNIEREYNKLNISIVHGWVTGNGQGPYPWLQDKYGSVVIANGIGYSENIANSIAHEIGHTIGLLHTFHRNGCRTNCFQESVSRTRTQEGYCIFTSGKLKCEVNGDCLCDTHADPSNVAGVEYGCDYYNITNTNQANNKCAITDNYGLSWLQAPLNNALRNLMTYNGFCDSDNEITKMQQGVMYHYIGKTSNSMKYNADVDFYENDNFYQPKAFTSITTFNPDSYCNLASINSKQYHTFHHSAGTACDVDWIYFQPFKWFNGSSPVPISKPYVIQTQEVVGKPKPDTKITLFAVLSDNSLIQLATHDNNSATDLFSKITQTLPYTYNTPGVQYM